MLAMIVHAIALVLDVLLFLSRFTNAQRVLVVSVGREGDELALKFSPEVVYANVGDQVQFQFYPLVGICCLSRKVCYRDLRHGGSEGLHTGNIESFGCTGKV